MKKLIGLVSVAMASSCLINAPLFASESLLDAEMANLDKPFSPYILNGSDTPITDVPWQAYVETHVYDRVGRCGGSVIADSATGEAKWILTAAHCFDIDYNLGGITISMRPQDAGDVYVSTGEADMNAPAFKARAQSAHKVYIHSSWDNESHSMNADIALIELGSAVQLPAKAIKVASDFVQDAYDLAAWQHRHAPEQSQLISGYGFTNPRNSQPELPGNLKAVNTYAITDAACRKEFEEFANQHGTVLSSMLYDDQAFVCAGIDPAQNLDPVNQIGACQGDSGGPMAWTDEDTQESYLVGVTSWGGNYMASVYRCGNTSTVYTQVSHYTAWIEQCMEGACTQANIISGSSTTDTVTKPKTDNVPDITKVKKPKTNVSGGSGGAMSYFALPFFLLIAFRRRFIAAC